MAESKDDRAVKLTLPDRIVGWFSASAAARRARDRTVQAYYEAARADRTRKGRRENGSGNDAVLRAGPSLRQQARHFEQNYDLALGVINALVNNIVGARGIGIEPQPRNKDGSINDTLAKEISTLYKDWCRQPEVTGMHNWSSAQRMLCRSWVRDGEVFAQQLMGPVAYLDHGTTVPYSLELLECDYVPMDMQSATPRIVQGVELNTWGRPLAYHTYKENPNEFSTLVGVSQTKRIPAASMLHLANRHRIRQLRGVSVFASVLGRFDNLKDYEESERIAAMIAASMAAYIKKGAPEDYTVPETETAPRNMKFKPGMVFDDLRIGEEIGTIDTSRPNPNLETYRNGQLKAVAAGTGPTFSTVARTYDGTYSAQRQELVEGWSAYAVLADEFISRIVRPSYESFIATAIASGQLRVPAEVERETLDDAEYIPPQMPWIDPLKEANAWEKLTQAGFASEVEVIRRRGGNPSDVLEQTALFRQRASERDLVFTSNAANSGNQPTAPAPTEPPDDDEGTGAGKRKDT
jgi:lambda family phage portal protein